METSQTLCPFYLQCLGDIFLNFEDNISDMTSDYCIPRVLHDAVIDLVIYVTLLPW